MPARLASIVVAITLSWPLAAHAQRPELPQLVWSAPASCPNAERVQQTIERWLARAREPVDASTLGVRARVHRDADHWNLELVLSSASGRSVDRLSAKDCDTLVQVVVLKVALAADLAAALRTLDTQVAPESPPRVALRAGAGVAVGRLPSASTGFGVAGAVDVPRVRFELAVAYSPSNSVRYTEPRGVGADFQLLTGQLRGCAMPDLGGLQLPICLGVELGVMRGSGVGSDTRFDADQFFGEVVLGPALRWPLSRALFAWIELSGSVAFARPRYQVRYLPRLFRPDATAARAWLGLELEL